MNNLSKVQLSELELDALAELVNLGVGNAALGLREMVQEKYVTADRSRRPAPWWFPYDDEYARMMGVHNRAMHARSYPVRLLNQLRLLTFPRFWRRASLGAILRNADRLF